MSNLLLVGIFCERSVGSEEILKLTEIHFICTIDCANEIISIITDKIDWRRTSLNSAFSSITYDVDESARFIPFYLLFNGTVTR